jgi:carboxypeptidase C (cathepsin A)
MAAIAFLAGATAPAVAQSAKPPADSPVLQIPPVGPSAEQWRDRGAPDVIPARRFVADRQGIFGGRKMRYRVVAEDQIMRNSKGAPIGSIFSFSYLKQPTPRAAERPVVFIFNGGPGSSSVWLHMGIIGPRMASFRDLTPRQVPPFQVVDNPKSLLAVADLVFVDPVGTGFSRYWGEGSAADFYGREEDAAQTVRFINAWLRKHGRWNSPKFLLGESYGTIRVNLVARRLMGGFLDGTFKGVSLNGVILLGYDGELAKAEGNEQFLMTFTTFAATAWYHGRADRAGRSFDAFIADADRFARDELVPALDKGAALTGEEMARIARKHASFSGLDVPYLLSKRLRIMPSDFRVRLLADRGLALGHYDARYVLPLAGSLGDPVADDPAMGLYSAPYIGAFNHYIRDDLGIDIDDDYIVIDWVNVNLKWNQSGAGKGDAGADLAAVMRRNPDLRMMSIQGWFDLFGPVGTIEYGIAQRNLPKDRVTAKNYLSGHMPYVGEAGPIMADDLKSFILSASNPAPRGLPE